MHKFVPCTVPPMLASRAALLAAGVLCLHSAAAWAPRTPSLSGVPPRPLAAAAVRRGDACTRTRAHASVAGAGPEAGEWQTLACGGAAGTAVCKRVIEPGSAKRAAAGAEVQIEYVGILAERQWSADDVAACWLEAQTFRAPFGVVPKEGEYYAQQEMAVYRDAFLAHQVDGGKLLDEDVFTEEYVVQTLGVSNKQVAHEFWSASLPSRSLSPGQALTHPPRARAISPYRDLRMASVHVYLQSVHARAHTLSLSHARCILRGTHVGVVKRRHAHGHSYAWKCTNSMPKSWRAQQRS